MGAMLQQGAKALLRLTAAASSSTFAPRHRPRTPTRAQRQEGNEISCRERSSFACAMHLDNETHFPKPRIGQLCAQ